MKLEKIAMEMVLMSKEATRPGEGPSTIMTDRMDKFMNEGQAHDNEITEDNVDPRELQRGIEVEMEHTSDASIAKKIALDHLAEIDDYYTRLDKMESEAEAG